MDILCLNKEDIAAVVTISDIIQADKDALAIYSSQEAQIPLRINLSVPQEEGQSLFMPGYAQKASALGIKIVSVFPNNAVRGKNNVPATMILLDETTGEVNAIMDGTYLTQLRTGAVSGAATDLLARKDSKVFALFGTGGQAAEQLAAVLSVRPIEEVNVFDISSQCAHDFVDAMQKRFGGLSIDFKVANAPKDAVQNADIITAVTTSKHPVFSASDVKAGAHINGVGSYTPDMREIDSALLGRADKIYLDTRDGVLNESGDFIHPINEGIFSVDTITGELGEAINGDAPLRENAEEITFFKSTGSAVLDIVAAKKIYDKAIANGRGQKISIG